MLQILSIHQLSIFLITYLILFELNYYYYKKVFIKKESNFYICNPKRVDSVSWITRTLNSISPYFFLSLACDVIPTFLIHQSNLRRLNCAKFHRFGPICRTAIAQTNGIWSAQIDHLLLKHCENLHLNVLHLRSVGQSCSDFTKTCPFIRTNVTFLQ